MAPLLALLALALAASVPSAFQRSMAQGQPAPSSNGTVDFAAAWCAARRAERSQPLAPDTPTAPPGYVAPPPMPPGFTPINYTTASFFLDSWNYTDLVNTVIDPALINQSVIEMRFRAHSDVPAADLAKARLPYLFDVRLAPTYEDSCGHCDALHLSERFRGLQSPVEPCCGVCLDMLNACPMAPRQLEDLLDVYREQGFEFDGLSPRYLHGFLRNKTLWFVGDGQMLQLYAATECFLRELAPTLRRTLSPFASNETLHAHWHSHYSASGCDSGFHGYCLQLIDRGRVCAVKACTGKVVVEKLLPLLRQHHAELAGDLMILNFGRHYSATAPLEADLKAFAAYFKANRQLLPRTYWMETTMEHLRPSSGSPPNAHGVRDCRPALDYYDPSSPAYGYLRDGGRKNVQLALPILRDAGVPTWNAWNATVPLWFMHRTRLHKTDDCLHYCSPGAPEVWLFLMFKYFEQEALQHHLDWKEKLWTDIWKQYDCSGNLTSPFDTGGVNATAPPSPTPSPSLPRLRRR